MLGNVYLNKDNWKGYGPWYDILTHFKKGIRRRRSRKESIVFGMARRCSRSSGGIGRCMSMN